MHGGDFADAAGEVSMDPERVVNLAANICWRAIMKSVDSPSLHGMHFLIRPTFCHYEQVVISDVTVRTKGDPHNLRIEDIPMPLVTREMSTGPPGDA